MRGNTIKISNTLNENVDCLSDEEVTLRIESLTANLQKFQDVQSQVKAEIEEEYLQNVIDYGFELGRFKHLLHKSKITPIKKEVFSSPP